MDPKKLSFLWPPHTYRGMHAPSIYSYTIYKKKTKKRIETLSLKIEGETEPWRLSSPCDHVHIHEQVFTHGIQRGRAGAEGRGRGRENMKHRTARDWWGWPPRGQMHLMPEWSKETRFMLWMLYHD